jgi:hypothetical protein
VKLNDISTEYLLKEYYLQSFTYLNCTDKHLYNLIKRELQKRKGAKHEDNNNKTNR